MIGWFRFVAVDIFLPVLICAVMLVGYDRMINSDFLDDDDGEEPGT